MTQRDPLAMIIYGIGMLLLTLQLKAAVPTSLQPWFVKDAAVGGGFEEVTEVFRLLATTVPARGYFPKPTKSILVVKPAMVERAKAHFDHLGFTVVTGTRYLGGFIGSYPEKSSHILQKVSKWTTSIAQLSSGAHSFPQVAFAEF